MATELIEGTSASSSSSRVEAVEKTVYLSGRGVGASTFCSPTNLDSWCSIFSCASACGATVPKLSAGLNLKLFVSTVKSQSQAFGENLTQLYTVVVGSVYPDVVDTIPGVIPFLWQYNQRVLISSFADGTESRRLVWKSPRKDVMISYRYLIREEAQQLYDFYQKQEGPLKSFSFFFPNPQSYEKEYCGVYTGQTLNINLPSQVSDGGAYRKLYNGGTEVTNYTFYPRGGPDGGDRATLLFTPSIGDNFYFTFVGRLRLNVRFSDAAIQVSEIKDRFSSFAIELIGLEASFI